MATTIFVMYFDIMVKNIQNSVECQYILAWDNLHAHIIVSFLSSSLAIKICRSKVNKVDGP